MKNLVSFPLLPHEAGKLPSIPAQAYVGFFDALTRRLVFVFDHETGQACLYVSTEGWNRAFVMQPGRLPGGIILNSPEKLPGQWPAGKSSGAGLRWGRASESPR
jgi:hypothetical protein